MSHTPVRHRFIRLLLPFALCVSMVPLAVAPTTAAGDVIGGVYVDASSGNDANPGTAAEPFKTLTHALASAAATTAIDTVLVQPGTYDAANGEVFPLINEGTSLIGAQGPEVTIIRGNGTSGILVGAGFTEGNVISGLTFTGGGVDAGAAMNIRLGSDTGPGSPLIQNNVFEGNTSSYIGGALVLTATGLGSLEPLVQGNTFRNNTAEQGGAVAIRGSVSAKLVGNVFDGNSAYMAGAILVLSSDSTIVIDNNTFVDNEARSLAGAVYMNPVGNQTHSICGNTFTTNHAAYDGGALFLNKGNITVSGNHASDNSAEGFGGFTRIGSAIVGAENNDIANSRGGEGGAAWHVTDGTLTELNDTVIDSVDSPSATTGEPAATVEIDNSIYWNPTLEMDIQRADSISYSCVSDSLVSDTSRGNIVGTDVIDSDPEFTAPGSGDPELPLGSPCIDTADSALAPDFDGFGHLRPQDGNGDSIPQPDMGCFEWGPLAEAESPAAEVPAAEEPSYVPVVVVPEIPESPEVTLSTRGSLPKAPRSAAPGSSRTKPLVVPDTTIAVVPDVIKTGGGRRK